MAMEVPVVFLIYNRPELAKKTLDRIREAKPKRLYLVGDGPKSEDETLEVIRCRELVTSGVDWDCEVKTNFSEQNLGLAERVSSGISWAFESCDRAIILEDDCIADETFFEFCREMLHRYEADERVVAVTGNNFQNGKRRGFGSYYFSMFPHCWGWATWKNRWDSYDHSMDAWAGARAFLSSFKSQALLEYWEARYLQVKEREVDSWAYRWVFSCWARNGLTVTPGSNLVENIGFGESATNCRKESKKFRNPVKALKFPLHHPGRVKQNRRADRYVLRKVFGIEL